jgi:multiple sugar transport system permease protein
MATAQRAAQPIWQSRKLAWLTGRRGILVPLVLLAPFLVLFSVFLLYPIGYGLYLSFTRWDLVTPAQWVGWRNYERILDSSLFDKSLRNTAFFVILNAPLAVILPLLLAVLVDSPLLGRTVFRSAFTAPLMISVSSVGIIWQWFLNPTFGVINHYLEMIGLSGQNWLSESGWAMFAVSITTVWWTTGWNLILFLAGLQDIPEHLYDAAKVDGAGGWALFWDITLPGLRTTILFVSATTIIGSFRVFSQVLVMTNGGPFDSTRTLVFHVYETGFRNFRMGEASAIAWVLFVIVAVFVLLQFRFLRHSD